ncbi:MAG: diguanylate cyclase [Lachnospiraceae bacterium]|nr:diguanylate cyclase [Lachnospiraceae bacterium]
MDGSKEKATEKKVKRSRKGTISGHMYALAITPLVLFSLVITIIGIPLLTNLMYRSSEKELHDACMSTLLLMDATYPGDYRLKVNEQNFNDSLYLFKGDSNITMDYSVIDTMKKSTHLDISICFDNTRILTTLTDENGARMVGTGVADQIYKTVYVDGQEAFYHNTMIFDKPYFTYYMPLTSSHGNIQGIVAAARPASDVNKAIMKLILILVAVALILAGIMIFIVIRVSRPMTHAIENIFKFIRDSSGGNDTATLDESVLSRHDELGEMGENVLSLQRSMRNMMESDPLTGLFNRRSAHRRLGPIINKAKNSQDSFCICIGDIDFFKQVNDTYGHDAGDDVLVKVAETIREHMKNCGFVARWGGEEFLMVFDRMGLIMAENSLWGLLDKIRALEIRYDNYIIKVTMSFGVSEWDKEQSLDSLIKTADDKLYFAKKNGRNQVVSSIGEEGESENSEVTEIDKLLKSIASGAREHIPAPEDEGGHFENLSAKELEDILSGKADEEAAANGSDLLGQTISFSEDSYT